MKRTNDPLKSFLFINAIFLLLLVSCASSEEGEEENLTPEAQGISLSEQDKIGLVWSEEFESNSLDNSTWTHDIGDGSAFGIPGWGNQELQTYTASSKNLKIANGFLTITAIKENLWKVLYFS